MRHWTFAAAALLMLASCGQPQPAQDGAVETNAPPAAAGEVAVAQPWVRDSAGRTGTAAVFMTITSPVADRLLGGSSPVAEKTALMTMRAEDGTMGMRYIDAIDLPPGQPVSLDPTGLHVWLEDLKQPLKAGEAFALTLQFEKAGTREVAVSVIEPAAAAPMAEM